MTFRQWVQDIWFEHCEEVEAWERRAPTYGPREYFNKYKWWLRREYKHRFQTEPARGSNSQ